MKETFYRNTLQRPPKIKVREEGLLYRNVQQKSNNLFSSKFKGRTDTV